METRVYQMEKLICAFFFFSRKFFLRLLFKIGCNVALSNQTDNNCGFSEDKKTKNRITDIYDERGQGNIHSSRIPWWILSLQNISSFLFNNDNYISSLYIPFFTWSWGKLGKFQDQRMIATSTNFSDFKIQ